MGSEIRRAIYDEKVRQIIAQLKNGKTREKLAEEMGYNTYKSIDMYMRRKNFKWDSRKKNYVPDEDCRDGITVDESIIPTSKAYTVITLFTKQGNDADPKAIARLAGFRDHIEMAAYMKSKNYRWDSGRQNYVQTTAISDDETTPPEPPANRTTIPAGTLASPSGMENLLPLLETLEKHKERLMELILPEEEKGEIPRYIIPGVYVTKSVHMSSNIDRLVREFSRDKNISQREIFEVALVNFFRQYGYRREIDSILNR